MTWEERKIMLPSLSVVVASLFLLLSCKKNSTNPPAQAVPAQTPANGPGSRNEATVVTEMNSFSVDEVQHLPTCEATKKGQLAYVTSEQKLFMCEGTAWKELSLRAASVQSTPQPSKLLTRTVDEPAGDNCRYSGKKIESGIDTNANGTLEEDEVSSRVNVCEGNISKISKAIFAKHFRSIGVVISTYQHPLGCKATSAGTGWMIGSDIVATNQHVVEPSIDLACIAFTSAATLASLKIYFPKVNFDPDVLLRQGLPNYVGFEPSLLDFDEFAITKIDRTPTANATDKADLAFLQVPNTQRATIPVSTLTPSDESSKTLRASDDIVTVGYSRVQGPRLSMGQVFHLENCEALVRAYNGGAFKASDCLDGLRVAPKTLMFSFFGYGDHGGSGSPVFDRFGEVVGIHTWGAAEGQAPFNAAQTAAEVRKFFDKPRSWQNITP